MEIQQVWVIPPRHVLIDDVEIGLKELVGLAEAWYPVKSAELELRNELWRLSKANHQLVKLLSSVPDIIVVEIAAFYWQQLLKRALKFAGALTSDDADRLRPYLGLDELI